ncbi:hypothetical protein RHGRI_021153 [Rhododendron griersonianum]|uniref:Uncharacterized protein n=1 Tax=Rhododendron griersonianum TaxID=479676 RepID=A0AAV6JJD3_9ERIC|nr:hypothetical protein RHGRI_021153 [Rhododendron griersonianum]
MSAILPKSLGPTAWVLKVGTRVRVGVCVEVQLKSFVSEGMSDEVLKVWVLKLFHRGVSYQVSRCLKSLLYFTTAERHREVLHCYDRDIGDTGYMELQYGCKLNATVK